MPSAISGTLLLALKLALNARLCLFAAGSNPQGLWRAVFALFAVAQVHPRTLESVRRRTVCRAVAVYRPLSYFTFKQALSAMISYGVVQDLVALPDVRSLCPLLVGHTAGVHFVRHVRVCDALLY